MNKITKEMMWKKIKSDPSGRNSTTIIDEFVNLNINDGGIMMSTYPPTQIKNIRVRPNDATLDSGETTIGGISAKVSEAVAQGMKCINVIFEKGVYFFDDSVGGAQIKIDWDMSLHDVEVHIIGNGSTLIGSKNLMTADATPEMGYYKYQVCIDDVYNHLLVDGEGNLITDFYGPLHEMSGLVQFTDVDDANNDESQDCNVWKTTAVDNPKKMRIPNELGHTFGCYYDGANGKADTFIQIYCSYMSQIFRVKRCTEHYIIAEPTPVENGNYPFTGYITSLECWPQNLSYIAAAKTRKPYFRMINDPLECTAAYFRMADNNHGVVYAKNNDAHLCDSTCFFKAEYRMKGASISGLRFIGNKGTDEEGTYLIHVSCSNVPQSEKGWTSICDCQFEHIRSTAIRINEMSTFYFQRNMFRHYYKKCVYLNLSDDVHILDNTFIDGGLRQTNNGAIVCQNSGYHIARNKFEDYGYSGIFVGIGPSTTSTLLESIGIIEYNEFLMTPEYRNNGSYTPLMDGGAIYSATRNYLAVIRYNFISGHSGPNKNIGIYGDDGVQNMWVFCNMIINSRNYYAIDMRTANTRFDANMNNRIAYNIIDGCYRFEGKSTENQENNTDGSDGNYKGRNLVLYDVCSPFAKNSIRNLEETQIEEDTYIGGCKTEQLGVAIPYGRKMEIIENFKLPPFISSHLRDAYY